MTYLISISSSYRQSPPLPSSPATSNAVQTGRQVSHATPSDSEYSIPTPRFGLPSKIKVGGLSFGIGVLKTRLSSDRRRVLNAALNNIVSGQKPELDQDRRFFYHADYDYPKNNKISLRVSGEVDHQNNLRSLSASPIDLDTALAAKRERFTLDSAQFAPNIPLSGHRALPNKPSVIRSAILTQAIDAVRDKTGISPGHLEKLHDIACREDCLILFRPVDPHNAPLINDNYPTKGLEIKGKSANWGPQYGFICLDQSLSKLQAQPDKAIAASSKTQASCTEENGPQAIPLVLTHERLLYLQSAGLLHMAPNDGGYILDAEAPDGSYQTFAALAGANDKGYLIQNGDVPIQVLAPRLATYGSHHVQKAYVADFDLLAVMPNMKNFGGHDQRKDVVMDARGPLNFFQSEQYFLASGQSLQASHRHPVAASTERMINRITEREQRIADTINHELRPEFNSTELSGYADAWKLVHHGSDEGNVATEPETNLPATVICPVLHDLDPVLVLDSEQALRQLISVASRHGYRLAGNPGWTPDLKKDTLFSQRLDMWESLARRDSLF